MKLSALLFATAVGLPVLVLAESTLSDFQGTVVPTGEQLAWALDELDRSSNVTNFVDPGEPEDLVSEDRGFLPRSADEQNATESENRGITEADGGPQLVDEDGLPIYH